MPCFLWFLRQRFGRQPLSARLLVERNGTQGRLGPRHYPARPSLREGVRRSWRAIPQSRPHGDSAVHRPSETRKRTSKSVPPSTTIPINELGSSFYVTHPRLPLGDVVEGDCINDSLAALGTDGHRVACARASSARRAQANARDLVDDIFQFGGMTFMSAMPERMCRLGFHQRLAWHASACSAPSTRSCESALSPMRQRAIIAHDVHLGIYSSRGGR